MVYWKVKGGLIFLSSFTKDLWTFAQVFTHWLRKKVTSIVSKFEVFKNFGVNKLLWRRGYLSRPAIHFGMILLITLALFSSGIIGGAQIVSGSYPGVKDPRVLGVGDVAVQEVLNDTEVPAQTIISDKVRDEIITYKVQNGDTLSSIAQKFDLTPETIKWANTLSDVDSLQIGQELKILPVSGVAHKVQSGDSIYTIAKKYRIDPQPIVDFPFNNIGEDLAISIGQILIVPGGEPPAPVLQPRPAAPQYLAQVPLAFTGTSGFIWPTNGVITQYFSWYHPAIDIANPAGPAVVAADSGKVIVAGYPDRLGYGNRVMIDHGNGYTTLYAHLSKIYVSTEPGKNMVKKGDTIGQMGSTGRSTGTHLHLEIRRNGAALNPLSFLK